MKKKTLHGLYKALLPICDSYNTMAEMPNFTWVKHNTLAYASWESTDKYVRWKLYFYSIVSFCDNQRSLDQIFKMTYTLDDHFNLDSFIVNFTDTYLAENYSMIGLYCCDHSTKKPNSEMKFTKTDLSFTEMAGYISTRLTTDKKFEVMDIFRQISEIVEESDEDATFQSINDFFKTVFNPNNIEYDRKYSYELDSPHYHLYAVYSHERFFDIKILDRTNDSDVYTDRIEIQQKSDGRITIDTPYMESCTNGITHKHQFICNSSDSIKTTFMRIEKDFSGYGTNIYADEVINLLSSICTDESKETKSVKKKLGDCTLQELHDYCAKRHGKCDTCPLTNTVHYDDDEHELCIITNDNCRCVDEIGCLDKEIEL